jgi:hypothetical protein
MGSCVCQKEKASKKSTKDLELTPQRYTVVVLRLITINTTAHDHRRPQVSTQNRAVTVTMVDYEGQRLSELIFHVLIITCGSIGWVIGYIQQDFTVCVQAWLVGVILSVIVSELGQRHRLGASLIVHSNLFHRKYRY